MKLDSDRIPRFLLLLGVFAPITMMVVVIVVGQITPDYNPISDTISQMGTPESPYALVLNSGFIIYSILIGVAAYGFHRRLRNTVMGNALVILLGIHAVGTMLLAIFPDSPEFAGKHFTEDILHNTLSAISYPALLIAILVFTRIAHQEKALRITAIIGFAVVVGLFAGNMLSMRQYLADMSGDLLSVYTPVHTLITIVAYFGLPLMVLGLLAPLAAREVPTRILLFFLVVAVVPVMELLVLAQLRLAAVTWYYGFVALAGFATP